MAASIGLAHSPKKCFAQYQMLVLDRYHMLVLDPPQNSWIPVSRTRYQLMVLLSRYAILTGRAAGVPDGGNSFQHEGHRDDGISLGRCTPAAAA